MYYVFHISISRIYHLNEIDSNVLRKLKMCAVKHCLMSTNIYENAYLCAR